MALCLPQFGIEMEGQIPEEFGRIAVLKKLNEVVHAIDGFEGIGNQIYTKWMVVDEATMPTDPGYHAVEIVSPVLTTEADILEAYKVFNALREIGFEATPKIGGVHIHLSWKSPNPLELLSFRILVSCLAEDLYRLLNISPERMKWVGSLAELKDIALKAEEIYRRMNSQYQLTQQVSEETHKQWTELQLMSVNSSDSRMNHKKAFLRMTPNETIEIRGMNSTLDLERILLLKDMFFHLMDVAKNDIGYVFENLSSTGARVSLSELLIQTHFKDHDKIV